MLFAPEIPYCRVVDPIAVFDEPLTFDASAFEPTATLLAPSTLLVSVL